MTETTMSKCAECDGTGYIVCNSCAGDGTTESDDDDDEDDEASCWDCEGEGEVPCPTCNPTGE